MNLQNITDEQRKNYMNQSLEEKIELGKQVVREAFDKFGWEHTAIAWTGGKDSTLLLWLVKEVCEERNHEVPQTVFIDEGDVFDEIWEFVEKVTAEWNLKFDVAHNENVSSTAGKELGKIIKVADLDERNQTEVKRLDPDLTEFAYEPESYIGNHLMKTVASNMWLEAHPDVTALFVGVRWDEQEARSTDDFLRERDNPHHFRVEPILQFLEKDVWGATHDKNIPYVKLYEEGYRSLGARVTTEKADDKPAWEQDLDNTTERAGRRQDKEKIMSRLRDLGYM